MDSHAIVLVTTIWAARQPLGAANVTYAEERVPDMTDLIEMPTNQPVRVLLPEQRPPAPLPGASREIRPELVEAMIDMQPGGLAWRRTFHGTTDQIPHSRHFVGFLLADDHCKQDAELIVTELASNAVRHTSSGQAYGTFIVEIARTVATVTVAVYDCGWGGVPRFTTHCRTTTEHGRGLAIVTGLADAVGYEGSDEVGHKVWARLTRLRAQADSRFTR